MPQMSLGQIATLVAGEVSGDRDYLISALATLDSAEPGQLTFLANPKYASKLAHTRAGAVLVRAPELAQQIENAIIVANPYLAFAILTQHFIPDAVAPDTNIHPSAQIHPTAKLGDDVRIGANVVLEPHVQLGNRVRIDAGCVVGERSMIGDDCHLYANVSIYHDVTIGDRGIFHSGCVIGADGFGFAPSKEGWVKIHQLGGVSIGDDVEVGANTTIDRGALDDTRIGNGVKIDNQVQIAHNVVIGDNSAIAGCAAIAGSTQIGRHCTIAGGVGIIGHLTIADHVHITAMTLVSKSILEAGSYSSGTALEPTDKWRRTAARLRRIDDMATQVTQIDKQLKTLYKKG